MAARLGAGALIFSLLACASAEPTSLQELKDKMRSLNDKGVKIGFASSGSRNAVIVAADILLRIIVSTPDDGVSPRR